MINIINKVYIDLDKNIDTSTPFIVIGEILNKTNFEEDYKPIQSFDNLDELLSKYETIEKFMEYIKSVDHKLRIYVQSNDYNKLLTWIIEELKETFELTNIDDMINGFIDNEKLQNKHEFKYDSYIIPSGLLYSLENINEMPLEFLLYLSSKLDNIDKDIPLGKIKTIAEYIFVEYTLSVINMVRDRLFDDYSIIKKLYPSLKNKSLSRSDIIDIIYKKEELNNLINKRVVSIDDIGFIDKLVKLAFVDNNEKTPNSMPEFFMVIDLYFNPTINKFNEYFYELYNTRFFDHRKNKINVFLME